MKARGGGEDGGGDKEDKSCMGREERGEMREREEGRGLVRIGDEGKSRRWNDTAQIHYNKPAQG